MFCALDEWRPATKAAGRPTKPQTFSILGVAARQHLYLLRVVTSHLKTRITEQILTRKRGKWTPSRGVVPARCKGNFAVSGSARFVCELGSPWRCWTSVCTGCCPVSCSRNRRWAVPRLGSSPQRRGPVRQSPLSVSSPLPGGDKLHRWRISSPSLQLERPKRVYKVGRHCRTGVCSVVRRFLQWVVLYLRVFRLSFNSCFNNHVFF